MNMPAQEVIDQLGRQIAELAVRLAIAEARVAAFERAEIERAAKQEAEDG